MSILRHTLEVNDTINWEQLKDHSPFPEPKPAKPQPPARLKTQGLPGEPLRSDPIYQAKFGLLDKLISSRRERIIKDCQDQYEADHQDWQRKEQAITAENAAAEARYRSALEEAEKRYQAELAAWKDRHAQFLEKQRLSEEAVEKHRTAYLSGVPQMVVEYCDMVLSASDYPEYFLQEFDLDYNPETKILLGDYSLPSPDCIPTVKEVKYLQSRDEFVEQYLSQAQQTTLYDDLV